MAHQFPKRILQEGAETQMDKINNTCRRTLLKAVKVALKDEYEEVLKDPVFGPLLAIIENNLIYSGKIIHSFMCKQLRVSKLHELWFIFAKRPLRFSMQEFYAVTGLKYKEEPDVDFINWKNDKGVRLVYLSIIQSFLMAKDWKVYIPQEYIRLVMDFEKLRMYPWVFALMMSWLHQYSEQEKMCIRRTAMCWMDSHMRFRYGLWRQFKTLVLWESCSHLYHLLVISM
uniref:DUF1985 domain-containing protein n=1 Tax=Brassica oleracea var. oleracea TaxID=109376 RepID=A0A0D3DA99_BRAOL